MAVAQEAADWEGLILENVVGGMAIGVLQGEHHCIWGSDGREEHFHGKRGGGVQDKTELRGSSLRSWIIPF